MRYVLAKALRRRFTRELARAMPAFRERKVHSGLRGTFLYEWRATPSLTCYVALVVDPELDSFTVELAWSGSGHFPAQLRDHSPDMPPRAGAMRFHLRALWQPHRIEPSWSLVPRTPRELEVERTLVDPEVAVARKLALIEEHERHRAAAAVDPAAEPPPPAVELPITEALERIAPAVDDVVARLRRYALPYFAGVVREHGGAAEQRVGGAQPASPA